MRRAALYAAFAAIGTLAAAPAWADDFQPPAPKYNYPTSARADYVIGCLAANGMRHEMLQRCSCSIDTIANILPYDDYEKAETILAMQQGALGRRGAEFRNTPIARDETKKLQEAQAEATLHCH